MATKKGNLPPIVWKRFSGGRNTKLAADEIADGECVDCTNVTFDQETVRTRAGAVRLAPVKEGSSFEGLADYVKSDGNRFLLGSLNNTLYRMTTSGASWSVGAIDSGLVSFATSNDYAYFVAEGGTLHRTDGYSVDDWTLPAAPTTAPTATPVVWDINTCDTTTGWTSSNKTKVYGATTAVDCSTSTTINHEGGTSLYVNVLANSEGEKLQYDTGSGSTLDLSHADALSVWVYANKLGATMRLQIGEALSSEHAFEFTIAEANAWQQVYCDLSNIPASSRNAIRYMAWYVVNATTAFKFYFDEIRAVGEPEGIYYYAYTYRDSTRDLESPLSPATDAVVCEDLRRKVTVTVTGTGASGVDYIRIYRKGGGNANSWWYLAEVANPGASTTATYSDVLGEDDLGDWLNEFRAAAPNANQILSDRGRMYYVPASGDSLYISDRNAPSVVPSATTLDATEDTGIIIPIGQDDGQGLTGICRCSAANGKVVGKPNSVYLLLGDTVGEFRVVQLAAPTGVAHWRTMQDCGPYGTVWLGGDKMVYQYLPNVGVWEVGERIKNDTAHISDFSACCSAYRDQQYYLWDGLGNVWVLDFRYQSPSPPYRMGVWKGPYTGWDATAVVARDDNRIFFGDSDGYLWEAECGTDDNGAAIACTFRTKAQDAKMPGYYKRPHAFSLVAEGDGVNMTLTWRAGEQLWRVCGPYELAENADAPVEAAVPLEITGRYIQCELGWSGVATVHELATWYTVRR